MIKRILVVNVNWMGDVVFSSPIFKALKEAYPQSLISCLAPPRGKEILESIPHLDEIIIYDEEKEHRGPFAKLKLIGELKKRKFDIAFLLHRSLTKALFVYWAGIRERVGYDAKNRGWMLTHRVKESTTDVHRCDYYLRVIESFGVKVSDRFAALHVNPKAQDEIEQILHSKGMDEKDFLIVVNCGGNWDLKRWPKENFSRLIESLRREFNAKVVISGAKNDIGLVKSIIGPLTVTPIILTGQINLKQLIALMHKAQVVISADTGPLHLANAVGARVVGLFGPTRPEVTGPRGRGDTFILQHDVGCNREPCYYLECPENTCMQSITVEDVLEKIRQIKR